ncbi:MAG: ribonuclease HI [Oscillospiraceae bacterium]|nr:ribonuclease HI [Oscillospiraceae bacterium]
MDNVSLYTDGACSGNPGPGGWAAILKYGEHEKELSGYDPDTTNNRMELTGVIQGLQTLKRSCNVIVTTDSRYVADGINKGWAKKWRSNNWIKSDKKPALNSDLWVQLLDLCETHEVTFIWVRGHSDNPYNNRCDELAVAEYKNHSSGTPRASREN